jgi:MATE family multidrug resistance protein
MPSSVESSPTDSETVVSKPAHPAGSVRELLAIALPLIVSSGSLSLMYVFDRIFLTWLSQAALAAVLPASMLHWTIISIALGTAAYANTFIAQYEGANRKDRVAASLWQGVYLSILAGAVFLVFVPLAGPIFNWINDAPDIQAEEIGYFRIMIWGSFPLTLSVVLAAFFSGRGRTKTVMIVNVSGVILNIVLDYLLIFGDTADSAIANWSLFFLPSRFLGLGIEGAAIATVIAHCFTSVAFIVLIFRKQNRQSYGIWAHRRFDPELFRRFLRFGLPNGFQYLVDIAGFPAFILLIGRLGLILAPYAHFAKPDEFDSVRPMVEVLLRFVAVYCVFDTMAIVFGSAVRGAGDTRFSLLFGFVCCWLVMVLPTFIAWNWYGGDLMIGWTACTMCIVVMGIGFMIRFQLGRWKTMSIIEDAIRLETVATEGADAG